MKITVPMIFYALIAVLGVAIWIGWGLTYDVWLDVGLYTISIVFILAGIVGFFLYRARESGEEE